MEIENKTFVEKDLGNELKLKVEYKDGQIGLSIVHQGKIGGATVMAYVDAPALVDAITDIIPGETDDMLLDTWAQKLLSKKTV